VAATAAIPAPSRQLDNGARSPFYTSFMGLAGDRHRIFIGSGVTPALSIARAMPMHTAVKPDLRWAPQALKTQDDPALAIAYCISEVVMDVLGPLFWAVLLIAFVTGALGIGSLQ
jgi:hypothetical protein